MNAHSPFVLGLATLGAAMVSVGTAEGFALSGKSWAAGSVVVLQMGMGTSPAPLSDGNTSWDAAAAPALETWNQQMSRMQLSGVVNSTAPVASGDRVNSVVFSSTIFGQAFGRGTLGVTYYIYQGATLVEADVLFNRAQTFDSYRGALRFGGSGGFATADIRRTLLHELGHAIGLNHFEGDHIMAATVSGREVLSSDDIAGVQSIYGAPAPPPPTPPPTSGLSRLANISTRMKVGVDDNVLIGGFIVRGVQSKRIILRATGPSLALVIPGALGDPTLELYDGAGRRLAENNNWQEGSQAAEIVGTGLAPSHTAEAALVADLQPGNYTAIVRGFNRTQGVALVESFELGTTATRLVNLSTRGRIGVGDDALIGGLIMQGTNAKKVIVRALGPSLAAVLPGSLANPTLEMYNSAGTRIAANDNWGDSAQRDEITASTLPPSHSLESAIVATLAPGSYTAIVRGVNNGTGVGLVEVYDLDP